MSILVIRLFGRGLPFDFQGGLLPPPFLDYNSADLGFVGAKVEFAVFVYQVRNTHWPSTAVHSPRSIIIYICIYFFCCFFLVGLGVFNQYLVG